MSDNKENAQLSDEETNPKKFPFVSRLIKFRAWNGSRMEEWFHVCADSGNAYQCSAGSGYGRSLCPGYSETFPEWKIMQFSGIQDKNGKDRYDGDIIKKTYRLYIY